MKNYSLLKNKVVVITGGSRGIGAEIAKACAANGADVAIIYRSREGEAKKIKKYIFSHGSRAEIFKCNIEDVNSIRKTVRQINRIFKKIDVLVNNAGILKQTPFEKINENEYDSILNINLKGVFFFSQAAVTFLIKSKGTIINIASVGGQRGGPKAVHYAASKAGIIGLTKSLSNLYSPKGIRVNAISPGQIETEMTKNIFNTEFYKKNIIPGIPLKRIGKPQDVANAALFLASDMSSYITGQVINVNGGEYLG